VQGNQPLEFIGQMRTPGRLPARESRFGNVERVRQVIGARHQVGSERLAVGGNAADRNAAESHAVVAAFTADEAHALRLSARTVITERDLQRRIDRLGS
jgi:hypothetical protein